MTRRRLAAVLLAASAALGATAAPAPVDRPNSDPTRWLGMGGWGRPVDPQGGGRFEREGDKLTITVARDGHHGHDHRHHRTNAPHLLRAVRGDFDVQVRVGGRFLPAYRSTRRVAGLLLAGGEDICYLERSAWQEKWFPTHEFWGTFYGPDARHLQRMKAHSPSAKWYLKMERRGKEITLLASEDGCKWYTVVCHELPGLPPEVKVGVFAGATDNGPFEAVFDEFSLTPLK